PRQVHAARAVPRHRVEIHRTVVAVDESEGKRAPGFALDQAGIEVRNPAPARWLRDGRDARSVAAVGTNTGKPRLLGPRRVEGKPTGVEAAVGQDLDEEAMAALRRVVPGAGDTRADREWRTSVHLGCGTCHCEAKGERRNE